MKVTLKVIAERAGVHISTVDKVIHNRGGVSKEVEDNIRSIIKELGYKTNPTGRALQRSGKRYRIAAVLLDVDARPYIAAGIREEMEKVNFDVDVSFRLSKFLDVEGQTTLLEEVISEGCDGIILMPNHSEKIERSVDLAKRSGIPVITVDSDIRRSGRLCHVGQDAVKSARIAGRMMGLFLRGEGKAAVITNSMDEEHFHDQVRTRVIEFTAFLRKNYPNIQIVRIVEGLEDRETIYANTVKLLREVPDLEGIFIACGGVDAAGKAIREEGRALQTSVVSFEEYPEILDLIREQVVDCTIGSSLMEQGRRSLRLLMDYLVYGTKPEKEAVYMSARILVKESL